MPLVSIIIPTYNYGHFLKDAAESLLAQTETDWECLIVDDGSTDETERFCGELIVEDKRFQYIFQTHQGLPAARNTGLQHAMGKYVQFLDADDWLEPGKIFHQRVFLENNPEIDIVYGDAIYRTDSRFLGSRGGSRARQSDRTAVFNDCLSDPLHALIKENVAAVNAFLIHRTVFEETGLFDESLEAYEDWDLWLRCALKGKQFSYSPEKDQTRALVRFHPGSMIHDKGKMLSALVRVRRKLAAALNEPAMSALNQQRLTYDEGRLAFHELKNGVTFNRLQRIFRATLAAV